MCRKGSYLKRSLLIATERKTGTDTSLMMGQMGYGDAWLIQTQGLASPADFCGLQHCLPSPPSPSQWGVYQLCHASNMILKALSLTR